MYSKSDVMFQFYESRHEHFGEYNFVNGLLHE